MKGLRIYNSLSPEERKARLKRKQDKREKEIHRVRRNRIIAIFSILIVFLGIQISVKVAQTNRINNQVQASKESLTKVKKQDKDLSVKRDDLKDPDYVAKLVRYKFYYSKPNEKIYNVPEENDN